MGLEQKEQLLEELRSKVNVLPGTGHIPAQVSSYMEHVFGNFADRHFYHPDKCQVFCEEVKDCWIWKCGEEIGDYKLLLKLANIALVQEFGKQFKERGKEQFSGWSQGLQVQVTQQRGQPQSYLCQVQISAFFTNDLGEKQEIVLLAKKQEHKCEDFFALRNKLPKYLEELAELFELR